MPPLLKKCKDAAEIGKTKGVDLFKSPTEQNRSRH
jgi:hypothetical protein